MLLSRQTPLYPGILADAERWERDGAIVLQPFSPNTEADRARLLNLIRMITGIPTFQLPCARGVQHARSEACSSASCCEAQSWLKRVDIVHAPHDDQYEMHIDTIVPSIKMFLYPDGASYTDGPFHFANGSHVASDELLRWLHQGSQGEARSFLFCGAWRTQLRDERIAELGYLSITPMVMRSDALLLADTSGLHRRGRAMPGIRRNTLTINFPPINSIPRELMLPFAHGARDAGY